MTVGLVQPTARRIGRSGRCSSACGGKLTARDYVNAAARSRSPRYHAYVGVPDSPKSTDGTDTPDGTVRIFFTYCLNAASEPGVTRPPEGTRLWPRRVCKVWIRHP